MAEADRNNTNFLKITTLEDTSRRQDPSTPSPDSGLRNTSPLTWASSSLTPTTEDLKWNSKPCVRVDALSSNNNSYEQLKQPRGQPWRPSIFQIGPLVGLAALLFVFLQMFATFGILTGSHGDLVSNWKYQPSVYLAVLTALSNKALAFATIQGTVVTFWLKAVQGTTLGQLHRDWVCSWLDQAESQPHKY